MGHPAAELNLETFKSYAKQIADPAMPEQARINATSAYKNNLECAVHTSTIANLDEVVQQVHDQIRDIILPVAADEAAPSRVRSYALGLVTLVPDKLAKHVSEHIEQQNKRTFLESVFNPDPKAAAVKKLQHQFHSYAGMLGSIANNEEDSNAKIPAQAKRQLPEIAAIAKRIDVSLDIKQHLSIEKGGYGHSCKPNSWTP